MNDPEPYDAVVIGGGKGGKTLAMYLARQNYKVALIERDPMMIGGGCIKRRLHPHKNVHHQCSTCSFHSASRRVRYQSGRVFGRLVRCPEAG
jgi:pyruvate/2-oxoglutarate dehydrogenase complex dihydrolipoamide dehydrogenase (E3) component